MIPRVKDYRRFVGKDFIDSLHEAAEPLLDKRLVHINSVYQGGGVAEILNSLVLLMNDLGIETGWRIIKGSPGFFAITKKFHNALHGGRINLSVHKKRIYLEELRRNALMTHLRSHDLVFVHDPQPLALIKSLRRPGQKWLWRCHIDISSPYRPVWNFLSDYCRKYDGMIVSRGEFRTRVRKPHFVVPPSIDPLSAKNEDLSRREVSKILSKNDIDTDVPILLQVSRFDKWKNIEGTLKAFRHVREKKRCQLVIIGSSAVDDPESKKIFERICDKVEKLRDVRLIAKHDDFLVNCLQREASVVFQMSKKEGFGLTASEALWKRTPVICSDVGGLPLQVIDGKTGFVVSSPLQASKRALQILDDPELEDSLGDRAHDHVRENFLITRHLMDYLRISDRFV